MQHKIRYQYLESRNRKSQFLQQCCYWRLNSIVQINRRDHLFICIFLKRIIIIYCRNEFREFSFRLLNKVFLLFRCSSSRRNPIIFSFRLLNKFSYFSVVVPVDEGVSGGARLDGAGQVDGAAGLYVKFVVANYCGFRFWNFTQTLELLFLKLTLLLNIRLSRCQFLLTSIQKKY